MWGIIVTGLLFIIFCWATVEYTLMYIKLSEFNARTISTLSCVRRFTQRDIQYDSITKPKDKSFGRLIRIVPFAMLNRLGIRV